MIFIGIYSFLSIVTFLLIFLGARKFNLPKKVSNAILLIANIVILLSIAQLDQIIALIALSTGVFFTGKKLLLLKNNKILGLLIAFLTIGFILKNYQIADLKILQRIGMSYVLFRFIHFMIEANNGKLKSIDLLTFVNYILFFPSFLAGPIDDYNNFHYWLNRGKSIYGNMLIKSGITRILVGVIKKYFLVPLIINYALTFSYFPSDLSWQLSLFLSLIFYSFYILLDFSGYSDIAIGTAYMMGIKSPENFNNPYGAKNLSEFWKKWHMTFSNFLFKYIFIPTATFLSEKLNKVKRIRITFLTYFVTFILCGIWHGNTMNFIYWGCWHAIGLILFKLVDLYVWNKKSTFLIQKTRHYLGMIITFIFVTFGWFFFNYSSDENSLIISSLNLSDDLEITEVTQITNQRNELGISIYTTEEINKDIKIHLNFVNQEHTTETENIIVSKHHLIIFPKEKNSGLYKIQLLQKDESSTHLGYMKSTIPAQSNLQKAIFWTYPSIKKIQP